MTESVTKITPLRPVESWENVSARAQRMRFSAEQRRQRRPTSLTILRQTTRLDLEDRRVSLDDGQTRIEAQAHRLELVQVREQITGDSRKVFKQLIEYAETPAPRTEFYAMAPGSPVPASTGQGFLAKNSAKSSAAAYQRAGFSPSTPPGAQVNLMA